MLVLLRRLLEWMLANRRYMTSMEISRESGMERYMVARRLSDLLADGKVERGATVKCLITSRPAITWRAK